MAWLAGLFCRAFVIAEYGNYEHGRDLTRVCELIGPDYVISAHPRTDREEVESICGARLEQR